MKKIYFLLMAIISGGMLFGQTVPNDWTAGQDLTTWQESTDPHGGTYCCKVAVGSTSNTKNDLTNDITIAVSDANDFKAKFWFKTSAHVKAKLRLEFNDPANTVLFSGGTAGATTWTSAQKLAQVPAGATSVTIGIRFSDETGFVAGEVQYVDDITFQSPSGTSLTVANGNMENWGLEPTPGDLIFTEVNATSDPSWKRKYTEIYNTTENTLSLNKVHLNYYDNGASSPTATLDLSGTIASYSYIVVARNADFSTYYGFNPDFILGAMKLDGDADVMVLNHDDNGTLDQFNDGPPATYSWSNKHLFYRFNYSADGSSIPNDWDDTGNNNTGTPKAPNTLTWDPEAENSNWNNKLNWDNGDTPSKGASVVIVAGTNQPFISGTPADPSACMDLTINSGASLKIGPGKALNVNGNITNNGTFRIRADATGTGSLLHNVNNVNAVVESYISQDQWHMVSAPINDALSAVFTGLYLMEYDESNTDSLFDNRWNFITALDYDLAEGRGFMAWSSSSTTGDATVNYNGTLNNGDLTVSGFSYTPAQPVDERGWNMVGNPFPSAIHGSTAWSRTNVDGTLYVYDLSVLGNYTTISISGGTGTHPTGDIAPGQGFWIKANDAGASLTIPQSERKHSTQQFYKSGTQMDELILSVEGNGYSDKMIVWFNDNATSDFDSEFDAWKFKGLEAAPQLYSVMGENNYTVNTLPFEGEDMTVQVNFEAGAEGLYTLTWSGLDNFNVSGNIILEDKKENKMIDLATLPSYTFGATPNDNNDRFVLHFGSLAQDINETQTTGYDIYSFGSKVYVKSSGMLNGEVKVVNMLGKTVYSSKMSNTNVFEFNLNVKPGYYLVYTTGNSGLTTKKVFIK